MRSFRYGLSCDKDCLGSSFHAYALIVLKSKFLSKSTWMSLPARAGGATNGAARRSRARQTMIRGGMVGEYTPPRSAPPGLQSDRPLFARRPGRDPVRPAQDVE